MSDIFQQLREKIAARLQGAATLAGVAVYARDESDLAQKIASSIAKSSGAAIYVFEPLPLEINSNVRPICIDHLEVRLRIVLNPVLAAQRNLPSASAMTLELLGLLSGWDPAMNEVNKLFPAGRVEDASGPRQTVRDVVFRTEAVYPLRD